MTAGNTDHLETDINPFHLAVLPEAGTAQCQPPLCGIGCASCSHKIAGAMNGDGSGTTGGIDTTPEEEKKAKDAAAQVAAMNLNALANSNAEVKTLIEKMNAMTKELEDGKKAQADLNARVKKGDEALAVLEKQKAAARRPGSRPSRRAWARRSSGRYSRTRPASSRRATSSSAAWRPCSTSPPRPRPRPRAPRPRRLRAEPAKD